MIDTKKLKAAMLLKDVTPTRMAGELDLSLKTFYRRMNEGNFWSEEITKIINILSLEHPWEIFFPNYAINKTDTA